MGTVFTGGKIHTLDPALPEVEALAAFGGRIVAVGSTAELSATFPTYRRLDLHGRAAFPGFIDSHIHFASFGLGLQIVQLGDAETLQTAVDRIAAVARQAEAGRWVFGRGWDKNPWPEGRFPTKEDLDPISPTVPVALTSKDGHLLWVNSVALKLAGIDQETPDPPGGEISRDRRGVPTGILKERAKGLIDRVLPHPGPQEIEQGIRQALGVAHRLGIVGVHTFEGPEVFAALQRLAARGELPLRVVMSIPEHNLDAAAQAGMATGFGNEWLRVGPVKVFADGALGSQTASMIEPFEGQPHNSGIATHSREELIELVGRAVHARFWCAIHAIGDRANRWVLDAYEAHRGPSARLGARHRIEHVQLLHPDDLNRLAALGVIASMQPIHATSDRDIADQYWGPRSRYAYAWHSLLAQGTRLAFGSDAPVETPDVFQGLYAAVTRRRVDDDRSAWYPEEAVSIAQALEAYTRGAAFAAGQEAHTGSLTVGRLADFVILDRDILRRPPEELPTTVVVATVIGGNVVYADATFGG